MSGGIPPLAAVLGLQPHPEGGWYCQTWVADSTIALPDGRVRPTATLIHFLLPAGEVSAWHRVASDEVWMAHLGHVDLELAGAGPAPGLAPEQRTVHRVGVDIADRQQTQVVVGAGVWQRTLPGTADALLSCLVSPGFDFADFELA